MKLARIAAGAGLLVTLGAGALAAQDLDSRWLPFIGCWERADATAAPSALTCIAPSADRRGVELAIVANNAIISTGRIEITAEPRAIDQDGCRGRETVSWSADGRRLFRSADLSCEGGLEQRATQLLAISYAGALLDAEGVTVASRTGVRLTRYRGLEDLAGLPDELVAAIRGRASAARRARTGASASVTDDDVVEASRLLPSPVVVAWLMDHGQNFQVNARRLEALDRNGVPGEVLDVLVAMTHGNVFRLDRVSLDAQFTPDSSGGAPAGSSTWGGIATPFYSYGAGGSCGRYSSGLYAYGSCEHSPYRYGLSGYGYRYDGFIWGGTPVIVVSPSGSNGFSGGRPPHGRVVNGVGYTGATGLGSGSNTGYPRGGTGGTTDTGTNADRGAAHAIGGGASGAGTSTGTGTGTGTGSTERTAKPRP